MEFGWSVEQEATRDRVRGVLEGAISPDWKEISSHGPGSSEVVAFSREFCPKLGAERLLVAYWPREYGGDEAGIWDQYILREELYAIGEPRGPQYMNSNWIGPAIMKFGTPEQKRHHLPLISGGHVCWCQGFSEPSAGSDLAAMRTAAERVSGGYNVNGSKIWTSYAQSAEYCFLLARTGAERREISVFLVPMDSPGIRVQPIKALVCDGSLNEVFFDNVFVSDAMRLGEENHGWDIVTYVLGQERSGSPKHVYSGSMLELAVEYLREQGRFDSPAVRERAARAKALCEASRWLNYKCVDTRSKDRDDGGEFNMARYLQSRGENIVSDFISDFIPESVMLASGNNGDMLPQLNAYVRRTTSAAIAVGSAEIQLNAVAQRALALPRGY